MSQITKNCCFTIKFSQCHLFAMAFNFKFYHILKTRSNSTHSSCYQHKMMSFTCRTKVEQCHSNRRICVCARICSSVRLCSQFQMNSVDRKFDDWFSKRLKGTGRETLYGHSSEDGYDRPNWLNCLDVCRHKIDSYRTKALGAFS